MNRHGGHQRKRHKRGNRHRCRKHQTEFAEHLPGGARQHGDGHKYTYQYGGSGDHRKHHLTGAEHRTRAHAQPQIATALNVLQHHDCIIHHQARCQHNRQQSQNVDGKAHYPNGRQGADQGNRNGDAGNQSHAKGAEEQPQGGDHNQNCVDQAGDHFRHRTANEHSAVFRNRQLNVVEPAIQILHRLAHAIGNFNGVGLRLTNDAETYDRRAVEVYQGLGIFWTE